MPEHAKARLAGSLLLAAVSWSCGGPAGHEPPEPPTGIEPLLAERLREATDAVRDDPTSGAAWGRLGEVYDVNSLEEPALECYARARELDPDDWHWPYFAGILLRPSDPVASLDLFTKAVELEPNYVPSRFRLGFAHYLAEDFDEAARHFEAALELDPGCVNARIGLARIALARGAPRDALTQLEQAAATSGDEGAVHMHLAQAHRELKQHREAVREEQLTAAAVHPALPDGFAALDDPARDEVKRRETVSSARLMEEALHYLRQGREEQALDLANRALESDPDSVTALLVSGRLLTKRGELDEARARLERAKALDPDHSAVLFELGTVHTLAGRIEPAIAALRKTLEIDPTFPAIRSNLAGLLVRAGRAPEAVELLREASREWPRDAYVQEKLAGVLLQLGRADEAVSALTRIVELEPGRVDMRANLGSTLWSLGRYAEAIGVFSRGVQFAPANRALNRWLAWSLATCPRDGLRDGQRALTIARRLCEQTDYRSPELLDALAAAQAETGDYERAAATARSGLEVFKATFGADASRMNAEQRRRFEEVSKSLRARIALYESGRPFRDGAGR